VVMMGVGHGDDDGDDGDDDDDNGDDAAADDDDACDQDPEELVTLEPEPPKVALKDHPKFARFFKMLAMNMPKGAAIQAMAKEGLDPAILDKVRPLDDYCR
jgi:hypothetical protein